MNAATTPSAAATSVGAVLRASKLATFDRRLPQVYTHVKGNWGAVKAPLPRQDKLPATYLTFRALDTAYRVPDLRVADEKVKAVERLVEQVPYVIPAKDFPHSRGMPQNSNTGRLADETMPLNVAEMSKTQFRKWLQSVDPSKVSPADRLRYKEALRAHIDPKNNNQNAAMERTVAGPVYTEWMADSTGQSPVVYGRILRQYNNVQSVGVSGFVFKNEVGTSKSQHGPSRSLAQYQIEHLYWDRRGRAHGQVSLVNSTTTGNRARKHEVENQVRASPQSKASVLSLLGTVMGSR